MSNVPRPVLHSRAACLALSLLCCSEPTAAQRFFQASPLPMAAQNAWALWLSGSLVSGLSTVGGESNVLALSFQRNRLVVSGRVSGSTESCSANVCRWPDPYDVAVVLAVASTGGRRLHASVGTGLALASYRNRNGFALPLEAQASWRATRYLGAGLYCWGNSIGPHAALTIVLQVGRLR